MAHQILNAPLIWLCGPPSTGKCLGKNTLVLTYDGRLTKVQDIRRGDLLMGPDSMPRRVLDTIVGTGPLYLVTPKKGKSWVCNSEHIHTVKDSLTEEVEDLSVRDLEKISAWKREKKKLFHVGVTFPKGEKLPLDPYFLGVWFGDGTKTLDRNGALAQVAITKPDPEIEDICRTTADDFDLNISEHSNSSECPTWRLVQQNPGGTRTNPLLDLIRSIVGSAQAVPQAYLIASREDRAKFLAGWIDTDGYTSPKIPSIEIVQKRFDWGHAVAFLARSLGFMVTEKIKHIEGYGDYLRLRIMGDFTSIPLRIPRRIPQARIKKRDPLRHGFNLAPIGDGEYFGFTLDGDGRFLLGDFTVTHNSAAAFTTFQDSYAILSSKNNMHYFKKRLMTNKLDQKLYRYPKRILLIDTTVSGATPKETPYVDTGTLQLKRPKGAKNDKGEDTYLPRIDTMGVLRATIGALVSQTQAAVEKGEAPPYPNVIVDELGELLDRCFSQMLPLHMTANNKPDTRGAFGEANEWIVQEIADNLRQLTTMGVGVCGTYHDREPDPAGKKKGGLKAVSANISRKLIAMSDGAIQFYVKDPEPNEKNEDGTPKQREVLLDAMPSQDWDLKLRGLDPEDGDRIARASLRDVLTVFAGFDLHTPEWQKGQVR